MNSPLPAINVAANSGGPKTYRCGSLTYTKAGLVGIFAWLLWGDFCLMLMEAVVPSVLPLKLKALGCSNVMMGLIMTTIPGTLNMTICPYASFKSDRYRSKWGRRIPFIASTMPFLCISLFMLGWSDEIRVVLQRHVPVLNGYAPVTVTLALIAFFMAMFQFFNMFVNSVFWYLFNDVVPPQFIGRFIGLLRIVSTLAAALYNYFIFKYAESHMREIFLGATVLYFVGFGLVCLMVKEGEYPLLEGESDRDNRGIAGIKTFLKESFSHKFYWLAFSATACGGMAGAIGGFNVFFFREMGLSLEQIGKLAAIGGVAVLAAMFLAAVFIDRWHPLRIRVYMTVFGVISSCASWVWIFVNLPGNYFFWLCAGSTLIGALQTALAVTAASPSQMRMFPQSRYGQFCSAQAMLVSFSIIGAGMLAGLFVDGVKHFCHDAEFAYRFNFLWSALFSSTSALLIILVYRDWYRMGGDKYFHPPAPWCAKKVEEIPIAPTVGPQTRWMNFSFRLLDAILALSVLGIPFLMWWMHCKQAMLAFKWFGILLLPLSVWVWLWWNWIRRGIQQDMGRIRNHQAPRNGLPHHGMLIVLGASFLLGSGMWLVQVILTINLGMNTEAIVFGVANVVTNFLLVGCVRLFVSIERGHLLTLDEALA